MKGVAVAVLVSAALAVSAVVPASDLPPTLLSLLSKELKFTASELAELEMGEVVAHRLGATAAGEVGAAGAVRVKGRKEAFVDLYRDIVNFKRGPDVVAIGLFHNPPSVADLEPLPLDARDVDLRSCRVADCDIRLPAATIQRFQHDVDWRSSGAEAHAAALFKDVLVEHVRALRIGGPGSSPSRRRETPGPACGGFLRLARWFVLHRGTCTGLSKHLMAFSSSPFPGAEDILYWSKEKFGNRRRL